MLPGEWNDIFGSRKQGFMCSHQLDSSAPAPPGDDVCPDGWVGYNGIGTV